MFIFLLQNVALWYSYLMHSHDDVIKWKHFPRYWPFVRGIHRSPVNSPHKGQWRGSLMFSLICVWINGWVNRREASDLRRYRAHYDVIVMLGFVMGGFHAAWWHKFTRHWSLMLPSWQWGRVMGYFLCVQNLTKVLHFYFSHSTMIYQYFVVKWLGTVQRELRDCRCSGDK